METLPENNSRWSRRNFLQATTLLPLTLKSVIIHPAVALPPAQDDSLNRSPLVGTSTVLPAHAHTLLPAAKIKAIVFDAFAIFDPRSVFKLAVQFFPEQGDALVAEWRTKQFEYTWLRSMSASYVDFLTVTAEALRYASKAVGVQLTENQQHQLVQAYYQLQPWSEVPTVLASLHAAGYRLGILSNFTAQMLAVNVRHNQLDQQFEQLLSVERVRKYKPDPATYAMAPLAFQLLKEQIVFVPFAGWDAAGSKNFGYKTFWVNRQQAFEEQLGVHPDATSRSLEELASFCQTL